MNLIVLYSLPLSFFSLVSEGSETHVIMTEIKHVFVRLWDNMCEFALPLPQRNCASARHKKLHHQVYDRHPVSERRTLPVGSPRVASENHDGRAKLGMTEGTKSVKCIFVKLNFHAPLLSAYHLGIETPFREAEGLGGLRLLILKIRA